MPKSRAMWACDLLLDRTSWTASCLNSRVKVRCSFGMILSLSVGSPLFQVYFLHFSGSRPSPRPSQAHAQDGCLLVGDRADDFARLLESAHVSVCARMLHHLGSGRVRDELVRSPPFSGRCPTFAWLLLPIR